MRWTVRDETRIYESEWVGLSTVDVELPDGTQIDHHVVRSMGDAAGVVVDRGDAVLLMYRHRFIVDRWGWEIPAGKIDPGETPEAGARRETVEETGWDVGTLEPLVAYAPAIGLMDQFFHLFVGRDAVQVGEPSDVHEAERIEWVPWNRIRPMIDAAEIHDGMSVAALALLLAR